MKDEGEEIALKQSIQSMDERVICLQQEDRRMIGYRNNGEWAIRQIHNSVPLDQLSELIEYLIRVLERVKPRSGGSSDRDYFSIRPLIYGGGYWLNDICRRELNRFDELEGEHLSVLLFRWNANATLFSLVETLRRGDRLGYFPGMIGVACPFTSSEAAGNILDRVRREFGLSSSSRLTYRNHFDNHPELKAKVETFQ